MQSFHYYRQSMHSVSVSSALLPFLLPELTQETLKASTLTSSIHAAISSHQAYLEGVQVSQDRIACISIHDIVAYRDCAQSPKIKEENYYAVYKAGRNAANMLKFLLQEACINALHGEGKIFGMTGCLRIKIFRKQGLRSNGKPPVADSPLQRIIPEAARHSSDLADRTSHSVSSS